MTINLGQLDPEIREAIFRLARFCGVGWRDRRGQPQMCDQTAVIVAVDNGLPLGLCHRHRAAYEQGKIR